MGLHATATMSKGDAFRVKAAQDRTVLSWDTKDTYNELTMAMGYDDWRYSPSLAMVQLDQLLVQVLEARNELARLTGRPVIDTRTLGPDGPDDPTDEPTDEPDAPAGAFRCARCHHTYRPSHLTDRGEHVPCRNGSCGCPGYVRQSDLDAGRDVAVWA